MWCGKLSKPLSLWWLFGWLMQVLGTFLFLPYHCPAVEVSPDLSVVVRDELSQMSVKWLKMLLFLSVCPSKFSVPIKGGRTEAWAPTSPPLSQHTLFNLLVEVCLVLKNKKQVANRSSWGAAGHGSVLLPLLGHAAEGWVSSEGVWAPYVSTDIGFRACRCKPWWHPDAMLSQESQQNHLRAKTTAERWKTLREGCCVLLVMLAAALTAAWCYRWNIKHLQPASTKLASDALDHSKACNVSHLGAQWGSSGLGQHEKSSLLLSPPPQRELAISGSTCHMVIADRMAGGEQKDDNHLV